MDVKITTVRIEVKLSNDKNLLKLETFWLEAICYSVTVNRLKIFVYTVLDFITAA